MAICQGDIILAKTPEQLEKLSQKPAVPGEHEPPAARRSVKALVRHGDELRWPLGEIPYVIQPTLPNQFGLFRALIQMLNIIQTTSHLYSTFQDRMRTREKFFIVRHLLGCSRAKCRR